MERQIEKDFVKTYIVKEKRERMLHELFHEKKREHAIGRFCHTTLKHIDGKKILYRGNKISYEELLEYMAAAGSKKCYIMSDDSNTDGRWLDIDDALNQIINSGGSVVVILSGLVIIKEEQEQGPAAKYVLRENL